MNRTRTTQDTEEGNENLTTDEQIVILVVSLPKNRHSLVPKGALRKRCLRHATLTNSKFAACRRQLTLNSKKVKVLCHTGLRNLKIAFQVVHRHHSPNRTKPYIFC